MSKKKSEICRTQGNVQKVIDVNFICQTSRFGCMPNFSDVLMPANFIYDKIVIMYVVLFHI